MVPSGARHNTSIAEYIFSIAAPITLPGGTTEISDIFDVLAGGEDEGTVRYDTWDMTQPVGAGLESKAIHVLPQCPVSIDWSYDMAKVTGSCWASMARTRASASCPGWRASSPAWTGSPGSLRSTWRGWPLGSSWGSAWPAPTTPIFSQQVFNLLLEECRLQGIRKLAVNANVSG